MNDYAITILLLVCMSLNITGSHETASSSATWQKISKQHCAIYIPGSPRSPGRVRPGSPCGPGRPSGPGRPAVPGGPTGPGDPGRPTHTHAELENY